MNTPRWSPFARRCVPSAVSLAQHGFLAVFAVFALAAFARAQSAGTIEGRVQNATTHSYLDNARVTVPGTNLETFTNSAGEYRLDGVPAGQATLKVFYTGLPEIENTVVVESGQTVERNFDLGVEKGGADVVKMDQFMVESRKQMDASNLAINEQRFASNIKNVVSADAFGDVTEGNVGEFVKYLPGISVDYVAADVRVISVRGFSSNYTPVLVDGHRMASAASSSASRSFELEQISMNNVSRTEVTKSNTPDMEAESLGGGVNLISRSGFEFAHPVFNYRAYISLNTEDLDLGRTRGPGQTSSRKYKPGFDFSYNVPVSKTFAFTLSGLNSNQFNEQHRSNPQWSGYGIAGASGSNISNPYLRKYTLQDGPKTTTRASTEITADWKPTKADLVSVRAQYNYYDAFFGNRNLNWDVGTTLPTAWSSASTQGATGAGSVQYGTSFRRKSGQTYDLDLAYQHRTREWTINADAYYSHATNHYRDTDNGYFENATETLKSVTVRFDAIERIRPDLITVTNAAGNTVDPYNLSNYTINTATSKPFESSDIFKGAHLDVKKDLGLSVPVSLKVGGALRQQDRTLAAPTHTWNFVGADGKAGTADDGAGGIADANYLGMYPKFGFPGMVWPSAYRLYDVYKAHPEYFQYDVQKSYLSDVQTTQAFTEKIGAAYAMAETRLLNNRLRLVGGLRFERTQDTGVGGLTDATAGFQRDVQGNLILVAGKPVKITDTAAQTADILARNKVLGYRASSSYNGYYPSANGSYNITDNLVARGAYSRTVGRPDLGNIIPSIQISDPSASGDQSITVSNPNLKPWKSDNFDASLEYYFDHPVGVVSIGVFEKQLHDFFGKSTRLATAEDLASVGLPDNSPIAYSYVTTTNIGSARITGFEFNYDQKLTFIPSAYGDVGVFLNGTQLHLQGPNTADFKNFVPRNYNWGIRYTLGRLGAQIKWNYRGAQKLNALLYTDPVTKQTVDLGGAAYFRSRLYLDVNLDYKLMNHLGFFANARNVTNVSQDQEQYDASTPAYARIFRREDYGVQFSLGVKGSF